MEPMSDTDLKMMFNENYGMLPTHLHRMVKRFNVSPSDWDMLTARYDTDWQAIREAILRGVKDGTRSFYYTLAGL